MAPTLRCLNTPVILQEISRALSGVLLLRHHLPGPGPAGSGEIKVWDAETGRELLTLQGHTGDVLNVAFSPDGQRLASGAFLDHTVRVWDAQTGQQLLVLKGQGSCLAFSRDGHWLRGCYRLWNATPLPEK